MNSSDFIHLELIWRRKMSATRGKRDEKSRSDRRLARYMLDELRKAREVEPISEPALTLEAEAWVAAAFGKFDANAADETE